MSATKDRASAAASAARWSVIVVLHNSRTALRACIASVPAAAELVVVDNDSSDGGGELARALRPGLRLVRQENLGFGAGCNSGARTATRELLLFLNPDAALTTDTLAVLAAVLDAHPRSLVGPQIVRPDGTIQYGVRRPIRARYEIAELLPRAVQWLPNSLRRDLPPTDPIYTSGGVVPTVQGSCFALTATQYATIGGCDERFFLYCEEDHLARRVRANGGDVRYQPATSALHIGQTSTGDGAHPNPLALHHLYRSYTLTYRLRYGRRYALSAAAAIVALVPLAIVEDTLRRALRRDTPPPAARRAIITGLIAGLRADIEPDLPSA